MRTIVLVCAATLWGVVFVVVLRVPGLPETPELLLSDGLQLVAALTAAVGCGFAARRTTGPRRRAWRWLAAGTGAWAAGQTVWSYYEVVLDREVPFPSFADVGFLLFPLLAAVGLVSWLGTQSDQLVARGRDVLDGTVIAGSLVALSWVTSLGSVVSEGGADWFGLALSVSYPVGDLILATLVLLALGRAARSERTTLVVLALGLGGLAVSDSAYVYLVSQGLYDSADMVSAGWVIGFLLVGVSGFSVTAEVPRPEYPGTSVAPAPTRPTLLRMVVPYVPLVVAGTVLCVSLLRHPSAPTIELALGIGLVVLVLTRQFLAMTDNHRLLVELGRTRDQLEHQALHDALTGLANRVLFTDRLDRALLQPGAEVSVLFCDLDDFKLVNDELGHEAGDLLLQLVAHKLLECVRATDTVARLGGDEFAILLEDASDAVEVADRVVASLRESMQVHGRGIHTSISVGIANHRGLPAGQVERRVTPERRNRERDLAADAERTATAQLLLRHADTAMYAAKGAGKGRAVVAATPAATSTAATVDA